MCLGRFNKLLVGMQTVPEYLIGDLELVTMLQSQRCTTVKFKINI